MPALPRDADPHQAPGLERGDSISADRNRSPQRKRSPRVPRGVGLSEPEMQ